MAADTQQQGPVDMEAFLRQAKYPLIKYTDMTAEMREEAMDVCITAVEKYPQDVEKCTQVGPAAAAATVVAEARATSVLLWVGYRVPIRGRCFVASYACLCVRQGG